MQHTMRFQRSVCANRTPATLAIPTSALEAALDYAQRGWYVLPLYGFTASGACACGHTACSLLGQHAQVDIQAATTDRATIMQWWQQDPAAIVGIATGRGLLVLEVNPLRGGDLKQFIDFYALPETSLARTHSGCWHLFFTYNPSFTIRTTKEKLGKGINSYGDGSFIVAPLSQLAGEDGTHWEKALSPVQLPSVMLPALLGQRLAKSAWTPSTDGQPSPAAQRLAGTLAHKPWLQPLSLRSEDTDLNMDELPMNTHNEKSPTHRHLMPLNTLLDMKVPEVAWVIPGLLREGVTLLTGQPMVGKSYLALEMALAVAQGSSVLGKYAPQTGDVLYLGLEDSMWSMSERAQKLLNGRTAPRNVTWAGSWDHLAQGGLADIEDWISQHPNVKLIVIDPLNSVMQPASPTRKPVKKLAFLTPLRMLAENHHIAILLVHQLTHQQTGTVLDDAMQINQATEMARETGGVLVLQKTLDDRAKVHVLGRDMETRSYTHIWRPE